MSGSVKRWLVRTEDGKEYGLSREDKPGWALAHYVVADHFGVTDSVVTTGWEFEDGTVVWGAGRWRRKGLNP